MSTAASENPKHQHDTAAALDPDCCDVGGMAGLAHSHEGEDDEHKLDLQILAVLLIEMHDQLAITVCSEHMTPGL